MKRERSEYSLPAGPRKSQLSDRVMEDVDTREQERDSNGQRKREGEGAVEREIGIACLMLNLMFWLAGERFSGA